MRRMLVVASKLKRMGAHEVWVRSRHAIWRRKVTALSRLGFPPSFEIQSGMAGKAFAGLEDVPQTIAELKRRLPEECDALCARAEHILQHRFDLLGYHDLQYGREIDWHLEPVSGKRIPLAPFYRLDLHDFNQVGDPKVVWELNRHQHLVTLARAYRLTNRAEFAAEAIAQWRHWQRCNPYPFGINWASSLEVAFRSLSWLWLLQLLRGTSHDNQDFNNDVCRALALNAYHIEHYLSTYSSPNTHLLGEAVALFFIGVLCPGLTNATELKQRGRQIVVREMDRQVRPDGMHFEHSTYYQVYALDFFLHFRLLAEVNHIAVPPQFDEKLKKMLDVLCALSAGAAPPRLGDDDGGRVFNPARNRAQHLTDPLATGAVLFEEPKYQSAVGKLCEESIWLLGPQRASAFDHLSAAKNANCSAAFDESGLYVLRGESLRAVVDAGRQGFARAGHWHAGALGVTVAMDGVECLTDPGTYSYIEGPEFRDLLRSTSAHNTLMIDHSNQVSITGRFAWKTMAEPVVKCWHHGNGFDFFQGSHGGYKHLPGRVTHERSVFRLGSHLIAVRDFVSGSGEHQLAANWHAAPGWKIEKSGHMAHFLNAGGLSLTMITASPQPWSTLVAASWSSPAYGIKESAEKLVFECVSQLPAELLTVCLPAEKRSANLFLTHSAAGGVSVYALNFGGELHEFFFALSPGIWKYESWTSDAIFLHAARGHGNELISLEACDCSLLRLGEKDLAAPGRRRSFEWRNPEGVNAIDAHDEELLTTPAKGNA